MKRSLAVAACICACLVAATAYATPGGKTILYGGAGQGKVVFDGRMHASKGFVCKDCHSEIFDTRKKALMSMEDHINPVACFACHNGTKAFDDCEKCHRLW